MHQWKNNLGLDQQRETLAAVLKDQKGRVAVTVTDSTADVDFGDLEVVVRGLGRSSHSLKADKAEI